MNIQPTKIRLAVTLIDVATRRIFVLHKDEFSKQRTLAGSTANVVIVQKTINILNSLQKTGVINDFDPKSIERFEFAGSDEVIGGIRRIFVTVPVDLDLRVAINSRIIHETLPLPKPQNRREAFYQEYLTALQVKLDLDKAA